MQNTKHTSHKHTEQGFTLVELSIVLVIIGLIIGGVLVGQDMIKAAEVRATLQQYEKYNSALNTFRTKYNDMPGDLSGATATNFGFLARNGGVGRGDANGLLEGCLAAATVACSETIIFWRDLSFANLVEQNFNTATDTASGAALAYTAAQIPTIYPPAKVGRGNYFAVYANSGLNYYQIAGISSVTVATGAQVLTNSLTPNEAFNMDNKIDDGAPATGIARAMEGTGPLNTAAASGAATCQFTGGLAYNTTTPALAATPLCQLRLRFN